MQPDEYKKMFSRVNGPLYTWRELRVVETAWTRPARVYARQNPSMKRRGRYKVPPLA